MLAALLQPDDDDQDSFDHRLLMQIARRWLVPGDAPAVPQHAAALFSREPEIGAGERARRALARFDEGQRGALVLHDYGGLPVERLAALFDIPADLAYAQLVRSRALFRREAGLDADQELRPALNTVAFAAPREHLWPLIEAELRAGLERRRRRQGLLTAAALVGVLLIVVGGGLLIFGQGGEGAEPATPTPATARVAGTAQAAPFTVLPTATPTPAANVGDAIVVSAGGRDAVRTSLLDADAGTIPLLPETGIEEGPPVVSPDGAQVMLLWYDLRDGGAVGYLTAWDGALTERQWEVQIATDEEVLPGERVDVQLSAAVDHSRVYVARHPWRGGANIEIDVFDRASGALQETIATNLPGFAANDVRLLAPPGLDRVHLFAITGDSPAESGSLNITFLAYQVPGGQRVHGRILRDQPDSRAFFLYESQLIAGGTTLFGVDRTLHYHHLAVHFFDISSGRLLPRLVLPFQPVADPLPYQQAVSNNGHWLYVLSPASLEVAVVNLFDRSLAGIVPLDPGVLAGAEIGVSYLPGRQMQMAPDGSRLYALGTGASGGSGVWVIDVGSWTVIDHWLPETPLAEILLSGDGQTLYLRGEAPLPPESGNPALLAIDTASGAASTLELPAAGRYSLASIATLYRRTYALSPAVGGRQPASSPLAGPLATARVEVRPTETLVSETVSIDVRFVHPLTGEPVAESGAGARYGEPVGVRVTWESDGDAPPVILELGRVEFGHYQGFVRLPGPGVWRARVDLDWPDGALVDRALIFEPAARIMPETSAAGAPPNAPGG